jgi:hypothetical protein
MKTRKTEITGANRGNGERISVLSVSSCSNPSVNIYSKRDGDVDFKFLARDTQPPYVDNRPMLFAGKPELRDYIPTRRDVVGDEEVSQFSDEITVNCTPLV